jgi:hypothetical protein
LASYALLTTLHSFGENVLHTVCLKFQDCGTGGFYLLIIFSVFKALPPVENRGSSHFIVYISLMEELQGFRIQSRNADAPASKNGSFKTTVTKNLTTVRGMKITPLLRYPHHYNLT